MFIYVGFLEFHNRQTVENTSFLPHGALIILSRQYNEPAFIMTYAKIPEYCRNVKNQGVGRLCQYDKLNNTTTFFKCSKQVSNRSYIGIRQLSDDSCLLSPRTFFTWVHI